MVLAARTLKRQGPIPGHPSAAVRALKSSLLATAGGKEPEIRRPQNDVLWQAKEASQSAEDRKARRRVPTRSAALSSVRSVRVRECAGVFRKAPCDKRRQQRVRGGGGAERALPRHPYDRIRTPASCPSVFLRRAWQALYDELTAKVKEQMKLALAKAKEYASKDYAGASDMAQKCARHLPA